MIRLAFLPLAVLVLSGCTHSAQNPQDTAEQISVEQLKYERERNKALRRLDHLSDARAISDGRIHIEARGSLGNGIQKVEDTFLIRASAAAVEAGYDGFTINYLTYESQFPLSISNGLTSYPEIVDISNYEEFLLHSKEQRLLVSATALNFKKIDGVILLKNKDDDGDLFSASELFDNFIMSYRSR